MKALPVLPPGPCMVRDLDLTRPLTHVAATRTSDGRSYHRILVLARLGVEPIGTVELPLGPLGLSPETTSVLLWHALGDTLNARRRAAGLDPLAEFPLAGLADLAPRSREATAHRPDRATVVIATRDRPLALQRCLTRLAAGPAPAEVIVVDNAPSDDAARDIVEAFDGGLRLRYVREARPGLGRAHNAALPLVQTPIVAFTDDDVEVEPTWLGELLAHFDDPSVGCVTGLIFPADLDEVAQQLIEAYAGFSKGFETTAYDLGENRPADPMFPFAAGRFGSGANMAFRTDVLRRLGGFDDALGAGTPAMGGDDLAAFVDVILDGSRLVYEPRAIVWHHHHRTMDALGRQAYGYGVGLGAFLARGVTRSPAVALDALRRLPLGVRHLLSPSSDKNARVPPGYPRAFLRRERRGVLAGPWRYLRSSRQARAGGVVDPGSGGSG